MEAGVPPKQIILDKQSGKDFDRPGYRKLCKKSSQVMCFLSRVSIDLVEIMVKYWSNGATYAMKKRISIVVLNMPLLDTRKGKDLTGELISDIVLQLLSYAAQTEREFIKQSQAEGIATAKDRGIKFGRRPLAKPPEYEQVYQRWLNQELSAR